MEQEKKVKKVKRERKPLKKMDIAAIVVMVIISIGIIGLVVGGFFAAHLLSTKPKLDLNVFNNEESSVIYDRHNKQIAELGYVRRENVTYDKIPNIVIDAFVATEDSRFFTHPGFDISRFSKAIIENIRSMSFSQGGSTFTMQLVKNNYFMDDEAGVGAANSVERKLQEIVLALELDSKISKETILESYLNKINYGGEGNIRGIEKAAEFYFSKSVTNLNLNEAAFLAGVINAPNANNPYNSFENANDRKNQVLYLMNLHGYISDTEYKVAQKVKVEDLLHNEAISEDGEIEEFKYQAYIDEVIKEVERETGFNPIDTPMKIYTNMDQKIQEVIDEMQKGEHGIEYPDERIEVASVIVNNHTGEILGILGGRNYAKGGALILNHATDQYNQPGSSIKPLLDYSLAFENLGWATSHVLLDEKTTIDGSVVISNFSGTYQGQTTIKDAVFNSLNTTAAYTLQEVCNKMGRQYAVDYLNNIGIETDIDKFNMQYSYGGSTFQVSAKTLASAQSTLFNGGVHVDAHTVKKVEFLDGREPVVIKPKKTEAISAQAAFLTTELLKNNVNSGHWLMSEIADSYQTYAKTGTSDWGTSGLSYGIPEGAAKDEWMVGSCADFTVATWLGYEKAEKGKKSYLDWDYDIPFNVPGKVIDVLLDTAVDIYGTKDAVEMPGGISSISHIIATFPYATPLQGMDKKYITSGYIKSDSINMVNPQSAKLSNMTGEITLANNSDGSYKITWPAYPDQSKLTVASSSMPIKGGTGRRLFDYSWAFGPVQYKATVSVNGNVVSNIATSKASYNFNVSANPGDTIEVCGFYGFEKSTNKSNTSCKSIEIENKEVNLTVPGNTSDYLNSNSWAILNSIYLVSQEAVADANHAAGSYAIFLNGVEVTGQTVTLTEQQIKQGQWIHYIYK